MLRLAVERSLELLGEAARNVSAELQAAHPEIPWRQIVGQRNILAHQYGLIDARRVWHTAKENVPALLEDLERLIPTEPH